MFDSSNKIDGQRDTVDSLSFFMNLKKDPEVVKIKSTIAREPDGKSRIKLETFAEVFYRMEKSHNVKEIDWVTVLEYFTKRGRPLTEEEIEERKQEDLEAEEEFEREQEEKQAEEEQFFKNLRDEQKDLGSTGREEHFYIEENKDDIEDMEVICSVNDKFRASATSADFNATHNTKKKVTFKDSLNDRESSVPSRPQTAKSRQDKILQKDSMAGSDYSDYKKSKGSLKSSRSITVPRPYSFDTRDKIRQKSIRERKIDEMIEMKRIEEENILGYRFKAKRPPKEVITPLYHQINEKNEVRRQEVKTNSMNMLKQSERPFTFYERDKDKKRQSGEFWNEEFLKPAFKAKEVPTICTVEIFKAMNTKKDKEREIRVQKMAEQNLLKSKLPPRMEIHEKLKQERAKSEQKIDPKLELLRFGTFQPPRAKVVPNFNRLQQSFQENLDKNKQSKQLIETKPFKFDQRADKKSERKTKASIRTFVDEENTTKGGSQHPQRKSFSKEIMQKRPEINPKTTKKQAAYEGKRRKELENKMKDEMKEIAENKDRYEKQNRIKKDVQNTYSALDNTKQKKIDSMNRLKKNIQDMKKAENTNKKVIEGMIQKGRSKELLVERYENSKNLTKQVFEDVRSMLNAKNSFNKNKVDPSKVLNKDLKDKLADAEYVKRNKK